MYAANLANRTRRHQAELSFVSKTFILATQLDVHLTNMQADPLAPINTVVQVERQAQVWIPTIQTASNP